VCSGMEGNVFDSGGSIASNLMRIPVYTYRGLLTVDSQGINTGPMIGPAGGKMSDRASRRETSQSTML
jgi:hypothetical protein